MKKLIFSQLLIAVFLFSGFSQGTFQSEYSGAGANVTHAVLTTSDSCFASAGIDGSGNLLVFKTDSVGNVLWSNSYGGTQMDEAADIKETSDGGLIVIGSTTSFGAGGSDILLLKIDASGTIQWANAYGATTNEYGYHVQQTSDGGYIFSSNTDAAGGDNIYLVKLDSNGDEIWSYVYGESPGESGVILETSDGGYAVGLDDGIMKLTNLGVVSWVASTFTFVQDILETSTGDFLVGGEQRGARIDILIAKVAANGTGVWSNLYEESGVSFDRFYAFAESQNGDYVCLIEPEGGGLGLMELNPSGTVNWVKHYSSISDPGASVYNHPRIDTTWDGGYIFAGAATSSLVRTDDQGNTNCAPYQIGSMTVAALAGPSGSTTGSLAVSPTKTTVTLTQNNYSLSKSDFTTGFGVGLSSTSDNCSGIGSVTASAGGGITPYTYSWSNGCNTASCTNLFEGTYSLVVSDAQGCTINDSTIIVDHVAETNNICLVSVDSATQFNKVIWEKPNVGYIDSFYIYREIGGNYLKIGAVDFALNGEFVDMTNGVNANITSYRYKLSVLDTCGYESDLSDFHETIHLTVNQGTGNDINLIWDSYEGVAFTQYRILRDTTGVGNWQVIDSVGIGSLTYTDINAPINANYMIEIVFSNSCDPLKVGTYQRTISNFASLNGTVGIDNQLLSNAFLVFPNPVQDQLHISFDGGKSFDIELYDTRGKLVLEGHSLNQEKQLNIKHILPGVYYLKVSSGSRINQFKIVKQ